MSDQDELMVADRLDGVPLPCENPCLFGHSAPEETFVSAYKSARLHHAWLIGGPRGTGKATLAFRMARYLLNHPDPEKAPAELGEVDPEGTVFRQIAQGGHPNLLYLARNFDAKTKTFKTRLSIDEVRRTQAFYGMTAGAGRWRITIVDTADDMNANATNALLKILEEPPKDSLFLILSDRPGRLLPTIRSRCRSLSLHGLAIEPFAKALETIGCALPQDQEKRDKLIRLSEGSVRRAIELMQGSALATSSLIESLTLNAANPDWTKIHDLGDKVSRRDAQNDYDLFVDLILVHIGKQVRVENQPIEMLARWSEVWEKTNRSIQLAESYNLDKKQVVLSVFRSLNEISGSA